MQKKNAQKVPRLLRVKMIMTFNIFERNTLDACEASRLTPYNGFSLVSVTVCKSVKDSTHSFSTRLLPFIETIKISCPCKTALSLIDESLKWRNPHP